MSFPFVYYAVWCMCAVLEITAACRMAGNEVGRRYPMVMLYLAACAVRTGALIFTWHDQKIYGTVFDTTMPVVLLVQSLAIVQVFWVMVEHYPNFRRVGSIGMVVLGAGSIAAVWFTSQFGIVPNATLRDFELLMQRHSSMAFSFLLVGIAVLLPRSPDLPIRASATRAATIFGLDSALYLLNSAALLAATPYAKTVPLHVKEVITLLPFFFKWMVGALWLLWMTPQSDRGKAAEPFTDADRWELMRLKVRLRPSGSR